MGWRGGASETASAQAFGANTGWLHLFLSPQTGHTLQLSYTGQQADDVLYPYLFMDAAYDDTNRVNAVFTAKDLGALATAKLQVYWKSHILSLLFSYVLRQLRIGRLQLLQAKIGIRLTTARLHGE